MRLSNRVNFVLAVLLVLVLFVLAVPLWADDGHGHDHDGGDVTTGDVTLSAGDTTLSGGDMIAGDSTLSTSNKTFAFSHSLGDVDINEGKNCLGSEAWGSFIISRQTNELNPWCAALFYELNGKHLFAAKMRCDIKEIGKKYLSVEACWSDQDLTPLVDDHDVHLRSEDYVTEDELEVADQAINRTIEIAVAQVNERLEALEHRPAQRPRVVQEQAPPPEQYTAEDRAYILGLYSKEEEDDDE
jgi:hypothetical protein